MTHHAPERERYQHDRPHQQDGLPHGEGVKQETGERGQAPMNLSSEIEEREGRIHHDKKSERNFRESLAELWIIPQKHPLQIGIHIPMQARRNEQYKEKSDMLGGF